MIAVIGSKWFRWIQELGVPAGDLELAPKVRFLNVATMVTFFPLTLNYLLELFAGRSSTAPYVLVTMLPLFAIFLCHKFKFYDSAKFLFLVVFVILFLCGNLIASYIGTENYLFAALLIGFNTLQRRSSIIALTLLYIVFYSIVIAGMDLGYLQQAGLPRYYYYANSSIAIMIVAVLIYRYTAIITTHVETMQKLNTDLHRQVDFSSGLLRELNHRVKNNLQIIASLFNLQGNSTSNPETRTALVDARNRINSLAILHQKLYQGDLVFEVDVHDYLESLCDYYRNRDNNNHEFEIKLEAPTVTLQIRETIYLGLIFNELITNALKYARRAGEKLTVEILLRYDKQELHLDVCDNGPGFVHSVPLKESFGLGLVRTIVEQYEGSITLQNKINSGAHISIRMTM